MNDRPTPRPTHAPNADLSPAEPIEDPRTASTDAAPAAPPAPRPEREPRAANGQQSRAQPADTAGPAPTPGAEATLVALAEAAAPSLSGDGLDDAHLGDAIRNLVEDVENRLAELRSMSERSAAAVSRAAEEQHRLDALREAVAREARGLDEARARQAADLEEARNGLARRNQDLEQKSRGLDHRERILKDAQQKLGDEAQSLERTRQELAASEQTLEARAATVEQRAKEVAEFARRSAAEHEQWQAAAREARAQEIAHFEDLLFQRANEVAALERRLEQAEATRIATEEHLATTATELADTRADLEQALQQAGEAMGQAEQLAGEDADRVRVIDELRSALASARAEAESQSRQLAIQARAIEEQRQAIAALTAERETRASTHQAEVERLAEAVRERDQQVRRLEDEIERTRQDAIGLQDRIEVLEGQLQNADRFDASDDVANGGIAGAAAAALTAGVASAAFDQEVRALRAEVARRDEAIAQLSQHIRALQIRIKESPTPTQAPTQAPSAATGSPGAATDEAASVTEVYEQKIAELEADNFRLRQRVDGLQTAEVVRKAQAADPLRRAGAMADRDTQFIARRRRRLERQRELMAERVQRVRMESRTLQQRLDHVRKVEQQQTQVAEMRRVLVVAEQRMIQRWARARSVTLCFLLVLMTLGLGMASYVGAMKFRPAAYHGSARIDAKARDGFPLTAEQASAWQHVHEGLVYSDAVADNFAERLRQMGGEPFSESRADTLAFLKESVVANAPEPGALELRFIGPGRDRTRRLLDTYAMALCSVANAQQSMRTDHARTVIGREAHVDLVPIADDRPLVAGIAFGGSLVLVMLVGGLVFLRLRRTPGLMDEFAGDEPGWAPPPPGAS